MANNVENVSLTSVKEVLHLCEQLEIWMAATTRKLSEMNYVPVNAVSQFKSSLVKCAEALTKMENKFDNILNGLTFWKNLSEITLIKSQVIKKAELINGMETKELLIAGIAEIKFTDFIYFSDL